ncbi:bv' protein [Escherichia coli DEC6B]|nr:bv' protein [Escherichia coli DEC6B]
MCKGSWTYANNKVITDTGCGNICLAGAVVEVIGTRGAMTIRVTTPSTSSGGGITNAQFTYINHGDAYAPGWRRDYNTKNQQPAFALGQTGSTVGNDKAVGWNWNSGVYNANIGGASTLILHFNMNTGSCPAVQFRVNYRNGGIFYRSARDGYGFEADWSEFYTTTRKPSAGDVGALPLSGGQLNGALGIGTSSALGGNSIVLGDNDTGFKQNGDGNLDVYANNVHVMRFVSGGIQSNKTINITGRVNPSDYGNFDSRYVKDVRLGSQQYYGVNNWQTWNFQCPSGHVLSGINVQDTGSNSADNIAGVYYRPVQKYINGTWYNVASV